MAKITARESAELKRRLNEHLKNADRFMKAGELELALAETERALEIEAGNIYARAFRKRINDAGFTRDEPARAPDSGEAPGAVPCPEPEPGPAPQPEQPHAWPEAVADFPDLTRLSDPGTRREYQRKLAAIMFTDMVNYSSLTQKNEVVALQLLEQHRRILRSVFPEFEGQEIKTIGDAFLVEFISVLQAVRCAIAIQNAMAAYNRAAAPDRQISLRIGVHIGDVIYREEDIIGDGVNIASRIQSSAEAGGICISQDVYNQVRTQQDIHVEEIGEVALKGILTPICLYKVFTSDEAYQRIEDQALQAAVEEGKQQAFSEMVERYLALAKAAMEIGSESEALSHVFALYSLNPGNADAKQIEQQIAAERKKAIAAKVEEARKIPREVFLETYARLVKRAWSDGSLSSIELSVLDNLRASFRISDDEHRTIERAMQMEVYREQVNAIRTNDTPEGRLLLERLRKDMKITDEDDNDRP